MAQFARIFFSGLDYSEFYFEIAFRSSLSKSSSSSCLVFFATLFSGWVQSIHPSIHPSDHRRTHTTLCLPQWVCRRINFLRKYTFNGKIICRDIPYNNKRLNIGRCIIRYFVAFSTLYPTFCLSSLFSWLCFRIRESPSPSFADADLVEEAEVTRIVCLLTARAPHTWSVGSVTTQSRFGVYQQQQQQQQQQQLASWSSSQI